MPIQSFPDPGEADETGLLAIGGDLYPESLELAYQNGIFPWPIENYPLTWFSPDPRAVLFFDELHLPRSLKRVANQNPFQHTTNKAFKAVIHACAEIPRGGTWITPEMIEAYSKLNELGLAVSTESWKNKQLVGGIYGVLTRGVFSAESMFHTESNASKLALLHLIDHLKEKNITWIDIQMQSPHMKSLGAKEIPRIEYLNLLKRSLLPSSTNVSK